MSHADDVRAYCRRIYVEHARAAGMTEICIRAGDVHKAMKYNHRMPLVCAAIGANIFATENSLRKFAVEGPTTGSNTVFRFKLL
jgi:hypothetical protein